LSRDFRRFLWTRLSATMANQMLLVALGWQMYDLTSSAWDLGLVGLLQFLPALLLALPAGHLVDRHDRRHMLAASLMVQTLAAVLLAAASGSSWVGRDTILAASVALGVARALQMPSQQALAPLLATAAQLPRALALSSATMQSAVIVGPALGGFVYASGAAVVYGLCAALFGAALSFLAAIRHRAVPAVKLPLSVATLLAGVRFIRHHPPVLGALSLDLFAVLLGGAVALLPIFARDVLHTGPWGLGLLRAAPALGALLTSAVLARAPIQRRVGRRLFGAVAVYGIATLVFAVSTHFMLSFAALAVSGGADMISVVIRQTLVQLDTPNEMRGRVSAVNSTFIGASNQLGEFESGATAAWLGPVGSVLLGGFGTLLVVVLWTRLFPSLAQRDALQPATPAGAQDAPAAEAVVEPTAAAVEAAAQAAQRPARPRPPPVVHHEESDD
jgi:MFS family permease